MKKLLIFLAAVMMVAAPVSVCAQTKAEQKQAKKQAKAFKREGWKALSSVSLDQLLAKHYNKLNNGCEELVGRSVANSQRYVTSVAIPNARQIAAAQYAEDQKSFIKGRIDLDMSDIGEEQRSNFVAGYERLVASELNGEIKTSVILTKENKDGKVDCLIYFLIDHDRARELARKSFEKALEEQKLAQEYGDKISDWVNAAFK